MPDHEKIFTEIYQSGVWGRKLSISGPGSDNEQTKKIVQELPKLFKEYDIKIVLDIPCGDFFWMQNVDLGSVEYIGGDVVKSVVDDNKRKYEQECISFCQLNLLTDKLPQVDLIFCRDCLVHFSDQDIISALMNMCASKSVYLLTTTFPNKENKGIPTGAWHPINLCESPFLLPEPILLINEGCTENDGVFSDKSLGLWSIEDLPNWYREGYDVKV